MRKFITFSIILLVSFYTGYSQNKSAVKNQITKSILYKTASLNNASDKITERCGTTEHMEWMMQQDPSLKQKMEIEENKIMDYVAAHYQELTKAKTVYQLAVIVHIVQRTSDPQVTNQQVTEQITQTNSDWAGTNTRSMESFAANLKANANITLCLATKDPNGVTLAVPGIHRVTTTTASFSTNDGVKFTSSGGTDAWDVTKYFNIWVCNLGPSLAGYAQFPTSGINSTYGVVINTTCWGLSGTAQYPFNGGGTLSHEGGHCLNLFHIWGDDGGACSGSDYCTDTPNQASETYGNHSGTLTDACSTTAPGIMYMNFMDYSDDADYANVTPNQVTRMQATVANYLTSVASNAATLCSTSSDPVAAFTGTPTTVLVGGTVTYTSQSSGTITSYNWSFPGGTPSTSTSAGPVSVTYNTVGVYNASLTVGTPTNTLTKPNYITVVDGSSPICDTLMASSFTSGTCNLTYYYIDVTPYDSGYVNGQNAYLDKEKAMLYTGGTAGTISDVYVLYSLKKGTTGNTSVKIYSSNAGAPGTLLGTSATIVKSAIDTTNQGVNYNNKYHFSTPVAVGTDFFVSVVLPTGFNNTTNQLVIWGSEYACSSTSPLAYEMWSDNSWNSFLSVYSTNIDLAIFPEVCTGITGISTIANDNISIFPNPANNEISVIIPNLSKEKANVQIFDIYGKLCKQLDVYSSIEGPAKINLNDLRSGIYLLQIESSKDKFVRKISIVK